MTDVNHYPGEPSNPEVHHERSDANVRGVIIFGVSLGLFCFASFIGLAYLFFALKGHEDRSKKTDYPLAVEDRGKLDQAPLARPVEGMLPPEPRLEGIDEIGKELGS